MKTRELIERLKELDPDGDMDVRIEVDCFTVGIDGVSYENSGGYECVYVFNQIGRAHV